MQANVSGNGPAHEATHLRESYVTLHELNSTNSIHTVIHTHFEAYIGCRNFKLLTARCDFPKFHRLHTFVDVLDAVHMEFSVM